MGRNAVTFGAAALVALLLAACVEAPPPPVGVQGKPLTAAERTECLVRGGSVGRGGIVPDEICFLPTADGGQSCTKAGDCAAGPCLSETRTCAKVTPMLGCFGLLDERGRAVDLCVD